MAKAHKNADFVLGNDCREPSSAHWSSALPATSPAVCIWQQYARQQIAATYHATCRRGATAEELPQKATAVCFRRHACRHATYLPCMLPGTAPVKPTYRSYYRAYRRGTTAKSYRRAYYRAYPRSTYLPGILPRDESYRAMGPAPSGRVIRM